MSELPIESGFDKRTLAMLRLISIFGEIKFRVVGENGDLQIE